MTDKSDGNPATDDTPYVVSLHDDIKQPSVHQMERRADLCISTLRRFVEAAGGRLELRVELPGHAPIRLTGLGDLNK